MDIASPLTSSAGRSASVIPSSASDASLVGVLRGEIVWKLDRLVLFVSDVRNPALLIERSYRLGPLRLSS
jgi:hypothetical protein